MSFTMMGNESMFFLIGFFGHQIIFIVGSQFQTKRFFSLTRMFTNLKRCCLWTNNSKKLIFVSKTWLNDPRISCNSFFNSIKLIVTNTDLEEKFKKVCNRWCFRNMMKTRFFHFDQILLIPFICINFGYLLKNWGLI
jgi:hypothetical protein